MSSRPVLHHERRACAFCQRGLVDQSGGDDVFEPTFTFHGFRYAEITGWGDAPVDGGIRVRDPSGIALVLAAS